MFAAVFVAITAAGLGWSFLPYLPANDSEIAYALVAGVIAAILVLPQARYFLWHGLTNSLVFEKPRPIAPWVIDGDTIDDLRTGVRYRLANIDAPETGDNAKCFKERERGELARAVAIRLVRAASIVSVQRTFRTDIYGRRVAFVLVDGEDLGRALTKRGLARPWVGLRRKWCGPRGGLAKIAATGSMTHNCGTCRAWR